MELQTISQVSKQFRISTRTLRYYEQIGLIQSTMKEDYSYRAYDEDAILRLKQIIVLRKLRIPLKSIAEILLTENTALAIEVFQQNLSEIEDEITALSTIKNAVKAFIERLNIKNTKLQLLDDESLLEIVDSLTVSKINFKEKTTMDDLEKADEKLNRLTDVRIIYLPPMTIAAASVTGGECEKVSGEMIDKFVRDNNLLKIKPDLRFFGFDCSKGKPGEYNNSYKYQSWVSIPDDMNVPEPLVKRSFSGGLYAAHMIMMGNFDHWKLLHDWVMNSDKYENDWSSARCTPIDADMDRCLEEQLNYMGNLNNPNFNHDDIQFDLLFPVKERN